MAATGLRFSHLMAGLWVAGALACGGGEGATLPAAAAGSGEGPAATEAAGGTRGTVLEHGVDVSGHSGTVDWQQVAAAGHTFAFLKATEGVDLKDPAFDAHWRALGDAGLVRGAYHFYVTEDDPEAQARFFIETVELRSGDLAPVVDVELIGHGTQPGLAERLRVYLDRIEAHYGVKPILYTAPRFWDEHLTADFGHYPLWVAEYEVEAPRLPAGWTAWHLWQWQADAEVPGVEKGADLSRLNRSGDVDLGALVVP